MSKVDTPSHHSSKKQKKCGSCHTFLTDLDPHPDCSKCFPRGCSKESPCSHCAPLSLDAWKKWERQQCSKRSSSSQGGFPRGPRGIRLRGEQVWEGLPRSSVYRISPYISREIYPRTKYYTDNLSYTQVTPSGKKLYRKQVEFSKFGRTMTRQW